MRPLARLVPWMTLVVVAVSLLTACTPLSPGSGPSSTKATASTIAGAANLCHLTSDKLASASSHQCSQIPVRLDSCEPNPAPYAGPRSVTINGQRINHPAFVCGQAFTEYVDFSYLGPWSGCNRPCSEVIRAAPVFPGQAATAYQPVEGRDAATVVCQGQGTLMNEGNITGHAPWYSAIWDKITYRSGPHMGLSGWIPDLWLGNQGWRGLAC